MNNTSTVSPNNNNKHTTFLFHHLAFVLGRQSDQVLQERLGIGMSQYKILMMLEENSRLQQRDIAASLGQTEASVSRQIKLLNRKDLLLTQVNPKDRRQHFSLVTLKGKRLTEAAANIVEDTHNEALGELTPKQQSQLTETLSTLHQYACQSGKTAACDPLLQIWQKT